MRYIPPRTIADHPGVAECTAPDDGFLPAEEGGPRHDVVLKAGWHFSMLQDGDRSNARFRTVAEFRAARPKPIGAHHRNPV